MHISKILFDVSGQLRSGLRVVSYIALFVFLSLIFVSGALLAVGIVFGIETAGSLPLYIAPSFAMLAAALTAGWLCAKRFEDLPFRSLGAWFTKRWWLHLFVGLILGVLSLSLAVGIAAMFGGLEFTVNPDQGGLAIMLTFVASFTVFAVAAAFEEALFRGYILQTMMRSGQMLPGILLTSALFATVHNANPSATTFSWINTFIAGVWFAVAYIRTRDLWLVTGMHLTWNWAQGAIFGIEVSGLTDLVSAPLLREIDHGPAWLTGGNYGIEGGIAATAALIISTVAVCYLPLVKPSDELLAMTSNHTDGSTPFGS